MASPKKTNSRYSIKQTYESKVAEPEDFSDFDALAQKFHPLIVASINKIIANPFYKKMEWDDCFQMALLILWKATRKFKPNRGVYFSVYLKTALHNSLMCQARNQTEHHYKKDPDRPGKFKRVPIFVLSLDLYNELPSEKEK